MRPVVPEARKNLAGHGRRQVDGRQDPFSAWASLPARPRVRSAALFACTLAVALSAGTAWAGTLTHAPFRIEYAEGERALAERTLRVLEEALTEFSPRLPPGDKPIRVVVCSTMAAFYKNAQRLGAQPVEGVARSEEGVIVVKAPELRSEAFDYEGTLRHELVHVLLARTSNLSALPRWLDEGIAMMVSKDFRWQSSVYVARMYVQNRILAYSDLDFAFIAPTSGLQFGEAYAQSLSMTRYLRDRVGEEAFWRLIREMKTVPFGTALRAMTGLTPIDVYEQWRRSLWKVALISSLMSGFSAFQLMAVLVIVAYWRKHRRGKRLLLQWEEEEALEDEEEILFPWQLEGDEPYESWETPDEEE